MSNQEALNGLPPQFVRLHRGRNWHRHTRGTSVTYCGKPVGSHYSVYAAIRQGWPRCRECEERNQAELRTIAFAEKLRSET